MGFVTGLAVGLIIGVVGMVLVWSWMKDQQTPAGYQVNFKVGPVREQSLGDRP